MATEDSTESPEQTNGYSSTPEGKKKKKKKRNLYGLTRYHFLTFNHQL